MTIVKDNDRYEGLGDRFPDRISIEEGTLEQAIALAEYMSNYYAGCDYLFYVEGTEDTQ